jgi:hypothetical protein
LLHISLDGHHLFSCWFPQDTLGKVYILTGEAEEKMNGEEGSEHEQQKWAVL